MPFRAPKTWWNALIHHNDCNEDHQEDLRISYGIHTVLRTRKVFPVRTSTATRLHAMRTGIPTRSGNPKSQFHKGSCPMWLLPAKFLSPDEKHVSRIENELRRDHEMMHQFTIEGDDYMELKRRVVGCILGEDITAMSSRVISIKDGIEVLKLANFCTKEIESVL